MPRVNLGSRPGLSEGQTGMGPMRSGYQPLASTIKYFDEMFGWNPRTRRDVLIQHAGPLNYQDYDVPLFWNDNTVADSINSNVIQTTNTKAAFAYFNVPRGGYLDSAHFLGEDDLAANDTNYLTFAITNKLGAAAGAVACLAATDPNTTKATGGAAITGLVPRALTVNGTAANLRLATGDTLAITATVTGTLANKIDAPKVRIRVYSVPSPWMPRYARTAGTVLVAPQPNVGNGRIALTLGATSEVQTAAVDFGDQLVVPATSRWMFNCRLKMPVAIGSNQRVLAGMISAYNATWDSITYGGTFRLEGGMDILAESDDNTTDRDDQDTGIDATADTDLWLSIFNPGDGYLRHFVDTKKCVISGSDEVFNVSQFANTNLLQPFIGVQKSSGAGVPSVVVDYARICWDALY